MVENKLGGLSGVVLVDTGSMQELRLDMGCHGLASTHRVVSNQIYINGAGNISTSVNSRKRGRSWRTNLHQLPSIKGHGLGSSEIGRTSGL
jgi:hypothetical protein